MTVYELIQELAVFRADQEVEVSFKTEDKFAECTECGKEIKVDDDDVTASDYSIGKIGSVVYIEAEE